MKDDLRSRNRTFDSRSIASFMDGYVSLLSRAFEAVDREQLAAAQAALVDAAENGKAIFAIGNGGSAAISDHLVCDLSKGTHHDQHPTLRAQSMTSNAALYSAMANDLGFENVFAGQIGLYGRPGDILIAISSSGESANIVRAVAAAGPVRPQPSRRRLRRPRPLHRRRRHRPPRLRRRLAIPVRPRRNICGITGSPSSMRTTPTSRAGRAPASPWLWWTPV